MTTDLQERIKSRMALEDCGFDTPCWISDRSTMPNGYTRIGIVGRRSPALTHRAAYEAFIGPIPDDLQIDHLCRQRACCNPDHLQPVTPRVNSLRSESFAAHQSKWTHCVNGHPLDGDNRYSPPGEPNSRLCRTCRRERVRQYQAAQRAKRSIVTMRPVAR